MRDMVAMKALDTMHVSNVQADNLIEGDVFLVTEGEAKLLEERGLAERGGSAAKAVNSPERLAARPDTREALDAERTGKAIGGAPRNKVIGAAPSNKAVGASPKTKSTRRR